MKKILFMMIFMVLCFTLSLFADIVVLKNGREIEGTILSQSGDFIVVKDDFNIEYKIQKTDVQAIQIVSQPQNTPQQIVVTPVSPVSAETEDNNSFSKSNTLTFDVNGITTANARIFPNGDRDYFAVKVEKPGEYSFTTTAKTVGSRLGIRILNGNNNLLKNWIWAEVGKDIVTTSIDINWDYIGQTLYFEVAQYGDNQVIDYIAKIAYHTIPDIWEPNGRFREAKQIKIDTNTESFIFPNGDRDYFKLTIPSQGRLSLVLRCADPNIRLGVRLLTDEYYLLRNWTWAADAGEVCELVQDFNAAEEIYLEVAHYGDNRRSFTPYALENTFNVIPDTHEPNGRFREASTININTDIIGYLFSTGDRDYFKFNIPRTGLVNFSASTADPLTRLQFRVLTDENALYHNWVVADENEGEVKLEREMTAGDYYMELAEYGDNYASMKPFKLNISLSPSSENFEENNSFATAKQLSLNTPYTAEIFPKGDRDYYKFDITRPGELNITIKPGPVHRLGLRILNADNGLFQNWIYAPDFAKELIVKTDIKKAGIYYIEVTDYADARGSIAPYTITVTLK
ncbi:MAG TPA: PPC domain-containing protein [Thermotogota bacterium]|nr:PPC domain-containing protein [Thermotogota bacterium]HPJ88598.1 PPC domain-containing protein [Thermotogota bacterium]